MRAALLGVTIPAHTPSEFGQQISSMTVELPNTGRVIPVLHGDDSERVLGRISGAVWATDGGLALDIVMANTSTARTFYAEELADTRWPMYAHPRHRRPASRWLPQPAPARGRPPVPDRVVANRRRPGRSSARVPDRHRACVIASVICFAQLQTIAADPSGSRFFREATPSRRVASAEISLPYVPFRKF